MATYSTTQDFIDAFGKREMVQLTNLDDAAARDINEAVLEQNRLKAFALINAIISHCAAIASQMPFAQVPPLLTNYELDITRYYLDRNMAREDVRKRFEDAIEYLKLVGKCQAGIGLDGAIPGGVIDTNNQVNAVVIPRLESPFREEVLNGYW